MRTTVLLVLLLPLFPITVFAEDASAGKECKRIVSLSPSITEVLFLIGLGEKVVGVTRYDKYPKEVVGIDKIGGFLDTNLEAVKALNPDVVFSLSEGHETAVQLRSLGIKVVEMEHRSIRGILDSILIAGSECSAVSVAAREVRRIQDEIDQITVKLEGRPRLSTLVSLGRDGDSGSIGTVYISGVDGFYTELLQLAGGENVYRGLTVAMPSLTAEGIISLKPQAIVEIVSADFEDLRDTKRRVDAWRNVSGLEAAQKGKVLVLTDDYARIPGPRFILLLRKIVQFLHPEVVL